MRLLNRTVYCGQKNFFDQVTLIDPSAVARWVLVGAEHPQKFFEEPLKRSGVDTILILQRTEDNNIKRSYWKEVRGNVKIGSQDRLIQFCSIICSSRTTSITTTLLSNSSLPYVTGVFELKIYAARHIPSRLCLMDDTRLDIIGCKKQCQKNFVFLPETVLYHSTADKYGNCVNQTKTLSNH